MTNSIGDVSKTIASVTSMDKAAAVPPPLFSRRSVRLRIAVLLCSAITVQNLMRNTLSMSLVCMMNTTWLAQVQRYLECHAFSRNTSRR